MTHKTWKNVKSSLLTLNKVPTKVNKPQRETNHQTLDKLSYNPKISQSWKHLEEAPSSSI
jgi:hypothetical protein